MTVSSLGLTPQDMECLLQILSRYAPLAEIWAFGSRVAGNARLFSDIDLVIIQDNPLELQAKAELRYALSESTLPIKVDIVEWVRTNPAFREIIQRNHIVLKSGSNAA